MQVLIVHHEAEIGQVLLGMVREYTAHPAKFVASNDAALEWAGQNAECDLLVIQLESEGVDGLTLAGSLGEKFPRLHTFFLPAYPLSARRLDVATEPEIATALLPSELDLTGQQFGTHRMGRKLTESFWDKVYEPEKKPIRRSVALDIVRAIA